MATTIWSSHFGRMRTPRWRFWLWMSTAHTTRVGTHWISSCGGENLWAASAKVAVHSHLKVSRWVIWPAADLQFRPLARREICECDIAMRVHALKISGRPTGRFSLSELGRSSRAPEGTYDLQFRSNDNATSASAETARLVWRPRSAKRLRREQPRRRECGGRLSSVRPARPHLGGYWADGPMECGYADRCIGSIRRFAGTVFRCCSKPGGRQNCGSLCDNRRCHRCAEGPRRRDFAAVRRSCARRHLYRPLASDCVAASGAVRHCGAATGQAQKYSTRLFTLTDFGWKKGEEAHAPRGAPRSRACHRAPSRRPG